mmetsp:Transcript_43785/g.101210  ORF Transcript_43785/g.101210 Transcript_43785/m.101210 type:complete len:807 (-) Transcript_43785:322-2742(-)
MPTRPQPAPGSRVSELGKRKVKATEKVLSQKEADDDRQKEAAATAQAATERSAATANRRALSPASSGGGRGRAGGSSDALALERRLQTGAQVEVLPAGASKAAAGWTERGDSSQMQSTRTRRGTVLSLSSSRALVRFDGAPAGSEEWLPYAQLRLIADADVEVACGACARPLGSPPPLTDRGPAVFGEWGPRHGEGGPETDRAVSGGPLSAAPVPEHLACTCCERRFHTACVQTLASHAGPQLAQPAPRDSGEPDAEAAFGADDVAADASLSLANQLCAAHAQHGARWRCPRCTARDTFGLGLSRLAAPLVPDRKSERALALATFEWLSSGDHGDVLLPPPLLGRGDAHLFGLDEYERDEQASTSIDDEATGDGDDFGHRWNVRGAPSHTSQTEAEMMSALFHAALDDAHVALIAADGIGAEQAGLAHAMADQAARSLLSLPARPASCAEPLELPTHGAATASLRAFASVPTPAGGRAVSALVTPTPSIKGRKRSKVETSPFPLAANGGGRVSPFGLGARGGDEGGDDDPRETPGAGGGGGGGSGNKRDCSGPATSRKTSLYRGVSKRHGRWKARVKRNGKEVVIGCFATEVQAAHAYDQFALQLHGTKAILNFQESAKTSPIQSDVPMSGKPVPHRSAILNLNAVRLIPADEKARTPGGRSRGGSTLDDENDDDDSEEEEDLDSEKELLLSSLRAQGARMPSGGRGIRDAALEAEVQALADDVLLDAEVHGLGAMPMPISPPDSQRVGEEETLHISQLFSPLDDEHLPTMSQIPELGSQMGSQELQIGLQLDSQELRAAMNEHIR